MTAPPDLREFDDRIAGIQVGADDFINKPFNKQILLLKIRNLLRSGQLSKQLAANFEEMKHHTGSRLFRTKKTLEKRLHRLFPTRFVPLYIMVSFTLIPYAEARRRARRQARALLLAGALVLILALLLLFWISRG